MKPVNMSFSWAAGRGLPSEGEEAGAGKSRRGWCWASRIGPGGAVRGAERGRAEKELSMVLNRAHPRLGSCPWCWTCSSRVQGAVRGVEPSCPSPNRASGGLLPLTLVRSRGRELVSHLPRQLQAGRANVTLSMKSLWICVKSKRKCEANNRKGQWEKCKESSLFVQGARSMCCCLS